MTDTIQARITLVGTPSADGAVGIQLDAYLALTNAGWRPPAFVLTATQSPQD